MKKIFSLTLFVLLLTGYCHGFYVCRPCCSWYQPCGWWGSGDYIFFWRKGAFFPPLVTENPSDLPTLATPGTTILFGNDKIRPTPKAGGRVDGGFWMTRCLGFGGSGFSLGQSEINYRLNADEQHPIFGQPFTNVSVGIFEDVHLLSFPGFRYDGQIRIKETNNLNGFDLYARYSFFSSKCFRMDLLGGYIFSQVSDNIRIRSKTTSSPLINTIAIEDRFRADNLYNGGLVGAIGEWKTCNWLFSITGKVGIGNMRKEVKITGNTTTTFPTFTLVRESGLLAQPSNIGSHVKDKFEAITQVVAKLNLRIYSHFWASLGYTYLFWPSVNLAPEQIDLHVNPTQSPGPLVGPRAPIFHEKSTSYWAQGVSGGLYVRY